MVMRHLGKMSWCCLVSFAGDSQLRIPKFELEIMFSNMVPLLSVELEYHTEWCALKSSRWYIYDGICRHHQMVQRRKVTFCARACWGVCRR